MHAMVSGERSGGALQGMITQAAAAVAQRERRGVEGAEEVGAPEIRT